VDPDNRRPVDYEQRRELLQQRGRLGGSVPLDELTGSMEDGRCKLFLTWKVLQLRREQPWWFSHGDYRALRAHGSRAHHVCAFARRCARQSLIVIAPRLFRRLLDDPTRLPLGSAVWENTLIELPRDERKRHVLRNVLDGVALQPVRQGDTVGILVAQALAQFPVALLTAGSEAGGSGAEASATQHYGVR
jgi:(1->4)-alpha-D-glucan 1-alpha-D-glucosylmutase